MTALGQAETSEQARLHAAHLARQRRIARAAVSRRIPITETREAVTVVPVRAVTPEAPVLITGDSVCEVRPRVTIDAVKRVVCAEFGVTHIDLISPRRLRAVARPRQVVMLIASRETLQSLHEIGRHLGGRDHTTVLHGIRTMEALIAGDAELAARVARCTARVRGEAGRDGT
jgi:chromosomal replication initiation ATPase DnaA